MVIKDKMYILKIQDTLLLSRICENCRGSQCKSFLSFGIKEGTQREVALCIPSLIPKDKNAFIWEP